MARAGTWLPLGVTVALSVVYLSITLDQQWYPWDDGALGEMATRTLSGQLPHRDFADAYTGGLSFFDAGVFWLFGTNLIWLRIAMIPFFVMFVAATYFILLRLVRPWIAALITATIVLWTVPNYAVAMPSWYNLYFAVAGIAAVVVWLEGKGDRWLMLAGVAGGLSIVVKIIGLYYVLGVIFFLVWRAALQVESRDGTSSWRQTRAKEVGVYALAACGLGATVWTLRPPLGHPQLVAFVSPIGAACAALALAAPRCGRSTVPIVRPVVVFLAGLAAPLVVFAIPYIATGSAVSVVHDVLDARTRLVYASRGPLAVTSLFSVLPFVVLPMIGRLPGKGRVIAAVFFAEAYLLAELSHDVTWYFMKPLREVLPVLGPAAAIAMTFAVRGRFSDRRTAELLGLFLFVAAFDSLVQFPFSVPIYFQYILPIVVLAAIAFMQLVAPRAALASIVFVAAYLAAGLLHLQPGLQGTWAQLQGKSKLSVLDSKRASILIPTDQVTKFQAIAHLIRRHAGSADMTIAGPDAPELYYLSGVGNATPMIYDFLSTHAARNRAVVAAAHRRDVHVVVVNSVPEFSPPYDRSIVDMLDKLFPHHKVIQEFDIRWRT